MSDPHWTAYLEAFAALLAAVGTVGAVALALEQSRRAIRQGQVQLSVRCRVAIAAPPEGTIQTYTVTATNVGLRQVTVTGAQFMLKDRQQVFVIPLYFSDALPAVLADGQSVALHYERGVVDQVAQDAGSEIDYVFVHDSADNSYQTTFPRVRDVEAGPPGRRGLWPSKDPDDYRR